MLIPNDRSQNYITHESIVTAKSLSKTVGEPSSPLHILHDINLNIKTGERIAIVGSSGSGKSTLLGLLAGLDTPSSGDVLIQGQPFSVLDEDARAVIRGKTMGFVFQSFQLLPAMTALENVMIPMQLNGQADAREVALVTLQKVGLESRISHYPKQLSGGEQQRVAIARAFASKPNVLFADEPTGNLDSVTGEKIIELLFLLNAENQTTLILVTHDMQLAARCERKVTLKQGQLHEDVA